MRKHALNQMDIPKDPLDLRLEVNEQKLKAMFAFCEDIRLTTRRYGPDLRYDALSIECESLIHQEKRDLLSSLLKDLALEVTARDQSGSAAQITFEQVEHYFDKQGISASEYQLLERLDQVADSVLSGQTVLLFEGWNRALSIGDVSVERRQVAEPALESVVMGPREATVENLKTNLGLLRFRLKSPRFKLRKITAGSEKKSDIVYAYLDGIVNPEMLAEFQKRLSKISDVDILDPSYIEELIEDSTYSPFPQYRYTERPDVAISALLAGKILVLMEGSPMILICPGLFIEFFQSSEDYYQRTLYSTFIRIMRMLAFTIALTLSSIYIAFSTYHPELIPSVLLLTIAKSREGIPFPAFVEAIVMEISFELLREAGIRLPQPIGSAISIVGALIIGEAAINAGIASPIMIVVVSLTGIASFALPQYNMAIAIRLLRFPLMALAAFLGGFGLMIGILAILLHLTKLRSLGQPYLSYVAPLRPKQLKDVFIRFPLKRLLRSSRGKSSLP